MREVTIALSFSACGTVCEKPSCTKSAQAREKKVARGVFGRRRVGGGEPFLQALSWSRVTISSEKSPPAHIIIFVATPSGVFFRDLLAQHVARREVADAELVTYARCLGAIAAEDDQGEGRTSGVVRALDCAPRLTIVPPIVWHRRIN